MCTCVYVHVCVGGCVCVCVGGWMGLCVCGVFTVVANTVLICSITHSPPLIRCGSRAECRGSICEKT